MPSYRFFYLAFGLVFLPVCYCAAQQLSLPSVAMVLEQESRLLRFEPIGIADTNRAVVKVLIREQEDAQPVMGATVLLRRDTDKMYGKVTMGDGRCWFKVSSGSYTVRVQLTGMDAFEEAGFTLQAGQSYHLEIAMARNMPAAKAPEQLAKGTKN